jgi:hypothetical protein
MVSIFLFFFSVVNIHLQKETVTDHPIWWHYLCISVPHQFKRPNSAFLFIDGGGITNQ